MQGAGHFHKATEDAADKPQKVVALGKVRKRDERRVRRHAQIWTPIPGIVRVQGEQPIGIGAVRRLPFTLHWYLMREDRENKQRKRAAVSRRLAGHDSSFFVCFFRYNIFFYERKQNGKNQTQSIFQSPRPAHGSDDGADHDAEWHGGVPH